MLIFDEIDTGISGRTAQKVSESLLRLSKRHQVILITEMIVERGLSDAAIRNNVLNGDSVHVFRLG